jgi:hypothetical protein
MGGVGADMAPDSPTCAPPTTAAAVAAIVPCSAAPPLTAVVLLPGRCHPWADIRVLLLCWSGYDPPGVATCDWLPAGRSLSIVQGITASQWWALCLGHMLDNLSSRIIAIQSTYLCCL